MERFLIDDGIKQSKIVANRYKWSIENADMGSEDANELHADICNQYVKEYEQIAEWLEELKSYKEAEEQGLLVRLPCPVGTTVWDICGMDIRENVVCGIECGKNGKQFLWANHDEWLGELNDLVFLTREAAEKKLEEF